MSASLKEIRRRLASLGRARRWQRWFCGWSVLVTATLCTLAGMFVIDVFFELDTIQRLTVLLISSAMLLWAVYRFARPYFGVRETEIELALITQSLHHIDTDLVAAIEFTSGEAASWGSPVLQEAVIRSVVARGPRLDLSRAVDRREPLRKLGFLAVTVVLVGGAIVCFPAHCFIFFERLCLSDEHYPSRTVISQIELNGHSVLRPGDGATPRVARCAERGPVEVRVRCGRRPPSAGELLIWPADGGGKRRVPLERVPTPGASSMPTPDAVLFAGSIPALLTALDYQVYLGDAWTNPARIEMIPLPQVQLRLAVRPPPYSRSQHADIPDERTYQVTVLQGSSVDLSLSCVNGKKLRGAEVEFRSAAGSTRCEMARQDAAGTTWQLTSENFAPLGSVQDMLRFDVHATDEDGLHPAQLPSGQIRVQADMSPTGLAATIHRAVLATAEPGITYRVSDDFGISRLRLQVDIERYGETAKELPGGDSSAEVHWLELPDLDYPVPADQLPTRGRYRLKLREWHLHKGDRLRVTLEITDYRGAGAGASVMSEPLYLEVSDEAGVLAAILEADQRTERELDEMIDRQLGLGDAP